MKFQGKRQCWESMGCGEVVRPTRITAGYAGPLLATKCRDGVRGVQAQTLGDCEKCDFFKAVVSD